MFYILSAGNSTRFGKPKILETYRHNRTLFNKLNIKYKIVTTEELYNSSLSVLDSRDKFLFIKGGNGSGVDALKLYSSVPRGFYLCWSDVFYTEETIRDIMFARNINPNENIFTVTEQDNPYTNIEFDEEYNFINYNKENETEVGYQDNSIFYIHSLQNKDFKEFLDIIKNDSKVLVTYNSNYYFNTKEELERIKNDTEI